MEAPAASRSLTALSREIAPIRAVAYLTISSASSIGSLAQFATLLSSLSTIVWSPATNGGPTQTHALVAGSPAIDAGNPNGCLDTTGAPLPTDQRGLPRAFDGNGDGRAACDIGAFELNAQDLSPAISITDVTVNE